MNRGFGKLNNRKFEGLKTHFVTAIKTPLTMDRSRFGL